MVVNIPQQPRFFLEENIPFHKVERPAFRNLMASGCPGYTVPTRYCLCTTIVNQEYGRIQKEIRDEIDKDITGFTLLMDGWSDRLRRSLYGFVLSRPGKAPLVLRLGDHSKVSSTAEYLMKTTEEVLQSYTEDISKICALVTDSPSVNKKLRRDMKAKYPALVVLPCILHALNLIIKSICVHEYAETALSHASKLTNAFRNRHNWNEFMVDYCKRNKLSMLCPIGETRWYSSRKTLSAVVGLEPAFKEAANSSEGKKTLNAAVRAACLDSATFAMAETLSNIIKPITDAIARLEDRQANLADCQIELYRIAYDLSELTEEDSVDSEPLRAFKAHVTNAFNIRYDEYADPLYMVALFLHPRCSRLALPIGKQQESFLDVGTAIMDIAEQWGMISEEGKPALGRQLNLYKNRLQWFAPTEVPEEDAVHWWENLVSSQETLVLKSLALRIFSISPGSADVERLFSSLAASNGKARSGVSARTLERIAQMKSFYVADTVKRKELGRISHSCIRKKRSKDVMAECDAFGRRVENFVAHSDAADHFSDVDTVADVLEDDLKEVRWPDEESIDHAHLAHTFSEAELEAVFCKEFSGPEHPEYSFQELLEEINEADLDSTHIIARDDLTIGDDGVMKSVIIGEAPTQVAPQASAVSVLQAANTTMRGPSGGSRSIMKNFLY
eukprot:gb/GECG01001944.1/.p1 GENE.gb/GECG01001944.1/~~gb/GECG01001944.1/.p1  ORF type:complete len:673 (+),score=78.62 gb/GECG01001944.1/:1-2019(+)